MFLSYFVLDFTCQHFCSLCVLIPITNSYHNLILNPLIIDCPKNYLHGDLERISPNRLLAFS